MVDRIIISRIVNCLNFLLTLNLEPKSFGLKFGEMMWFVGLTFVDRMLTGLSTKSLTALVFFPLALTN